MNDSLRLALRIRLLAAVLCLCGSAAVAQSTWWGLWNTGLGLTRQTTLDVGGNALYMRLTAQNSPMLVGASVGGVRFFLHDKSSVTSAKVWLSASYSSGFTPTVMMQEVPLADLRDMSHDGEPTVVTFAQDYPVIAAGNPYANILVGISIDTSRPLTLLSCVQNGVSGSCFVNGRDMSAVSGPLPLQVLCSGPLIPANGAQPQSLGEQLLPAGGPATLDVPVKVAGAAAVSSIDYVLTVDGQPQAEQHYDLPVPAGELGMAFSVPMTLDVPAPPQEYSVGIQVTKVNTQPNADATTAAAPLVALARQCLKRTVMEEFTGTWCLNCVRGFVGIDLLERLFADRFIAIAMHSDERDPMMVGDYRNSTFFAQKMKVLGGLPSCTLDRWIDCDPYCGMLTSGPFSTDALVAMALERTAVADVGVEAHFTDDSQTQIGISVSTHFAYDSQEAHYQLMLVLTADSLTGEGRAWMQRNGYDGYQGDDPNLVPFASLGAYITDMAYNHVAIDVAGVDMGLTGSIAAPLDSRQAQHFDYTMSIAGNELAQHKDKLGVVALLIDTRDGSVANAAKTRVALPAGIAARQLEEDETKADAAYNLNGQRTAKDAKGIVINRGRKVMTRFR